MWHDVRDALRGLRRSPWLTIGGVLTWAVGLGVLATVFSALHAALDPQLPFRDPDRLVMVYATRRTETGETRARWSYPVLERMAAARPEALAGIASFTSEGVSLAGAGPAARVTAEFVTPGYFHLLGLVPALGRLPAASSVNPSGGSAEIVVGDGLWQSRFGGQRSMLGRVVRLNGVDATIVGVMPPRAVGLSGAADLWAPGTLAPRVTFGEYLTSSEQFHNVVGRLAPGASLDQAAAELNALAAHMVWDDETGPADRGIGVVALGEARRERSAVRSRALLFAAAICLLLVASANVAGLLVTRLAARDRELAVRLALGCGPGRLLRALWIEVLVLSVAGLAAGLLVALWATGLVQALAPPALATPANDYHQLGSFADLRLDGVTLAVSAAATLGAGLVVSMLAFQRLDPRGLETLLRGSGRVAPPDSMGAAIVLQVAVAVALVGGAALMLGTLDRLQRVDPGIDTRGVVAFTVSRESGSDAADGRALVEGLLGRVSRVPGVVAVTSGQCTPFDARCARLGLRIAGRQATEEAPVVGWHRVGPDHFAALRIPVLQGRGFTPEDRLGRPPVVVVNRTAARRFWPGANPVGQRIVLPATLPGTPGTTAEIVGVVGDVLYWPLDAPPGPDVYQPALQFSYSWASVMVRVAGDAAMDVAALRRAVADVDPDLPIYDVTTLDAKWARGRADRRFVAVLLGAFAVCGLLLGAVGLYGATASWLAVRRRELAVRSALGASPGELVRHVLRQAMSRAALGVLLGLPLVVGVGRALGALLFGIAPSDPASFAAVAGIALGTTALAGSLAARRAARIDPVKELASW